MMNANEQLLEKTKASSEIYWSISGCGGYKMIPQNSFLLQDHITVMSHECYGMSNHWQLICLFNSCLDWHQWEYHSFTLLALCVGNPLLTGGFSLQRASNVESVSMSWHHYKDRNSLWSLQVISKCFNWQLVWYIWFTWWGKSWCWDLHHYWHTDSALNRNV